MLEAFNELMADPTSRAELVGGLVEVLIFIIPAGAYALSFRIRASLRRLPCDQLLLETHSADMAGRRELFMVK